jgi:hypothetical protein
MAGDTRNITPRADDREHDLVVGVPQYVAGVVDLEGPQGEHAGQREHRAEAEQDKWPVMSDCAETLLQAHRSGVALHDLAGGPEADQVERDPHDGQDQCGDGQRALEVLRAGDLRETTTDRAMIAPAAPSVRALASLARSWGSWVIADARDRKGC